MSTSHDDYGRTHGNDDSAEPADPKNPDHDLRRKLPLAPQSVKAERLPDPLTSDGEPLTVEESRKTYLRTQRASWTSEERTSKYERHRYEVYLRILNADRHFQDCFDGLTTAMVTRRLSPMDESGCWLTPWECNEMLHGGCLHRSIRESINYQLGDFSFEWLAVTAPTRSAGTPHEHIYIWIEDPSDDVTTDHLKPGLEKHLKHCVNAYQKDHQYRTDGGDGAITIEHTPEIVTEIPDRIHEVIDKTDGSIYWNTTGAQYLASQLAHLPLGDRYNGDRDNPPDELFEGAALAWASPYNWFRSSGGVAAL